MVLTRALETAYLHEFWAFLVLGVGDRFWTVFGFEKIPLWMVRSWDGWLWNPWKCLSQNEPEPAEQDFELEPSEPELAHVGTEPNRTVGFLEPWPFWISEPLHAHAITVIVPPGYAVPSRSHATNTASAFRD